MAVSGPAGSSSLSVAKISVFLCFLDFVCLVSPPQFLLQQHTKNMTASPPPTDINHSNTPDGTEPPPAATVIEQAVPAPATPRIPTAVRDAQRSSLAASRAAIQSRKIAAAAQSIICLYRRTRLRIEKRNALYPFPAAFYNTYGPFIPLSSRIDHQNSFGSTPNASATSSVVSQDKASFVVFYIPRVVLVRF